MYLLAVFLVVSFGTTASRCSANNLEEIEDDELRLFTKLFHNYKNNREVRPVKNKSSPVIVTLDLAYSQLVDLDAKNQIMTSNVWFRQVWNNERLTWNVSEYGGIESLNVDSSYVWKPDVVLYNNIESVKGGEMYKFDTKVVVSFDGRCSWFAPTQIQSNCKIDITYFPFDEQYCTMVFGPWTYTKSFLDMNQKSDSADLLMYTPNGEWHLVDVPATKHVIKYSCCPDPYVDITYTVKVRRRVLFYLNNMVIPCILLASLAAFSFFLPPGSGERISLVITLLLGLTVYMLIITENIPPTSEVTPLIGKFFMFMMGVIAMSLLSTSLTLSFYHHKPDAKMPDWFGTILFRCLAPALGITLPKHYKTPPNPIPLREINGVVHTSNLDIGFSRGKPVQLVRGIVEDRLESILQRLDEFMAVLKEKHENEEKQERWLYATVVMDRMFFWLFSMTIVLGSTAFYFSIPNYS